MKTNRIVRADSFWEFEDADSSLLIHETINKQMISMQQAGVSNLTIKHISLTERTEKQILVALVIFEFDSDDTELLASKYENAKEDIK